ncbi:hypothetical protein MTR_1g094920 [Medicago truncatula]|uniref:Uncharacterized protein n=1 Tax=Medicago truncatula TaxID=3880 RepID=G7I377_MEDTR|nr:hypothetical protein MTR_1g094920 [Medicago truncatula]
MQDERKLKPEQNKFVQAMGPTLHVLRVGPHVDQRGERIWTIFTYCGPYPVNQPIHFQLVFSAEARDVGSCSHIWMHHVMVGHNGTNAVPKQGPRQNVISRAFVGHHEYIVYPTNQP